LEQNMLRIFKDSLQTRLTELLNDKHKYMERISKPLNGQGPTDEADVGCFHHDRELLHILQGRNNKVVKEIRSAIDRIENGEFGICCACFGPIGLGRLRAQPTTVLCVDCRRELEFSSRTKAS